MSWNRLSETAIAAADAELERRHRSMRTPLLIALSMAVLITVLWTLGYRGGLSRGVLILGEGQALVQIKTFLIFGFALGITFFFAYRHQRRTGRSLFSEARSVICKACHRVADAHASEACSCGGNWEPIEHWEWVPDSRAATGDRDGDRDEIDFSKPKL